MGFDNEVDDAVKNVNNDNQEQKATNKLQPSDELLKALSALNGKDETASEPEAEAPDASEPELAPPKRYDSEPANPVDVPKAKKEFKMPDFKKAFSSVISKLPKPTDEEKIILKRVGIIACAIVAAIALVFGGIKVVNYAKTAYIRSYEKKYQVDFPDGIRKEFCDEFGKDQSFSGNLVIEDTSTDVKVFAKAKDGAALLDKGSDVKQDQHIRAIALDKSLGDLESVYKTPEGFLKASQKVTFRTLFDDEEYRVVAAYYTNTKPEDDAGYVFPYNTYGNLTEKSFYHFQDRIKSRRQYDTKYILLQENYILSISVPSDFMPNFRFVIVCVKTEDKFEKSKTAEPNKRVHYPQVWYDKNKQQNPFYLAGKWYPEIVLPDGKTKKLTYEDFK